MNSESNNISFKPSTFDHKIANAIVTGCKAEPPKPKMTSKLVQRIPPDWKKRRGKILEKLFRK